MKSRTNGSAISSPWRGGTISGSTRASPAGWRAETTQHFHPDWGADVDQVAAREDSDGARRFVTTHPVVQEVRTVEQTNQAFDAITYRKGPVGHLHARRLCRRRRVAIGHPRPTCASTPIGTRAPTTCGRRSKQAGAKGLIDGRPRFHQPAGHSADRRPVSAMRQRQHVATARPERNFRSTARRGAGTAAGWHVPVRATARGRRRRCMTQGATATVDGARLRPAADQSRPDRLLPHALSAQQHLALPGRCLFQA